MTTKSMIGSRQMATAATGLLLALAAGCAPEMEPVSLVERTRVLGARVEVEGSQADGPSRSTPRPGERATVRWLVTAPAEMPPLAWAFVLCPGLELGNDLHCTGEPLAVFQGVNEPVVTLTAPERSALGPATKLVLFGRICSDSVPVLDSASVPRCSNDGDGTTAALSIPIELDTPGNKNPTLAATELQLDGQPWAASEAGARCEELPQVMAGTKDHAIRIEAVGVERERYLVMMGDPPRPTPAREWLQISQFTTAGEFDRSFSSIEASDERERPSVEMEWEAPLAEKVPAEGQVVRFTFVVRDMRGGVDWLSRALCVQR